MKIKLENRFIEADWNQPALQRLPTMQNRWLSVSQSDEITADEFGWRWYKNLGVKVGTELKKEHDLTGFFIPKGFDAAKPVFLMGYFHGHRTSPEHCPNHKDASIKDYWEGDCTKYFDFRPAINGSEKNLILVAPTLSPTSGFDKDFPVSGFKTFVDKVIEEVNTQQKIIKKPIELANVTLILSAHSGGGKVMLQIMQQTSDYTKKVGEVWGFDSMYQNPDSWNKLAKANMNQRFYFFNKKDSPTDKQLSDKASNLFLCRAVIGHSKIPLAVLPTRLNRIGTIDKQPCKTDS